jgi:alkanesulfonate monooxygenase SsuD/methylene tetrahydromethanopterin reductase-like flavin-dependent oxidoreductase (luciferase family)
MLSEHFEVISRMTRRDVAPFTFSGEHARVHDVVNVPRTGGGDHVRLAIGGHGRNVTFRLAARYCDEVNIDASPDEMADAIAAVRGRCEEIDRDPASLMIVGGTNPAWPYPGLKAIGRQRMMRQEDVPAIMSADFSTLTTRTEEFAQWVELGLDRIICGVPGLVDTDEGLYELIDDLHAAGIELAPAPVSA